MFEYYLFKCMALLYALLYFLDELFHFSFFINKLSPYKKLKRKDENTRILSTKLVFNYTSPNRLNNNKNKKELKNLLLEDIQSENIWKEIRKNLKEYNNSLMIGDIIEVYYTVPFLNTEVKKEKEKEVNT